MIFSFFYQTTPPAGLLGGPLHRASAGKDILYFNVRPFPSKENKKTGSIPASPQP